MLILGENLFQIVFHGVSRYNVIIYCFSFPLSTFKIIQFKSCPRCTKIPLRLLSIFCIILQELVCPGAEPRWSLAELIHAVILMAHTHALCSFVWGCGLNPEPDHVGGYTFQPPSPSHLPRSPAHEDGKQEVSQPFLASTEENFGFITGNFFFSPKTC